MANLYVSRIIQVLKFILTVLMSIWEFKDYVQDPYWSKNKQLVTYMIVVLSINFFQDALNMLTGFMIGKNSLFPDYLLN